MPKIKSAKKALRQSKRRAAKNLAQKNIFRAKIKQLKKLIAEKQPEQAKNFLPQVYQILDKAAKTNIIRKNKAARLKSRLTHLTTKSVKAAS